MSDYTVLKKSPFFPIMHGLNKENLSDHKVGMLTEVDMTSAERLRRRVEAEAGVRPSYTALLTKAVSIALRENEHANRVLVGFRFWKRLVQLHRVDMTVAVERDEPGIEQAAFAATIQNTDEKNLAQITEELRDLANATPETNERWRQFNWIVRRLPATIALFVLRLPTRFAKMWVQHRGGAVMISSPAKYGVDLMVGAWPWPLGFSFGYVKDRPFVIDGELTVRPTMTITFSFDRRLMAGAPSARFFRRVCDLMEDAEAALWSEADAAGANAKHSQPSAQAG